MRSIFRPLGRPPSPLTTPVLGWEARRQYKRACSTPWNLVEPPPKPQPTRGTPATRARTPQLSQARIRHDPLAQEQLHDGTTALHRTNDFALLWQCPVCLSWTRDPLKFGYSKRCNLCKLARPPRVVIYRSLDVEHFRRHAALVHACAAQVRANRYNAICDGPLIRRKRDACVPVARVFLDLAAKRDEQLEPVPSVADITDQRWITQVFRDGERYIGFADRDCCSARPWPGVLDHMSALPIESTVRLSGRELPDEPLCSAELADTARGAR